MLEMLVVVLDKIIDVIMANAFVRNLIIGSFLVAFGVVLWGYWWWLNGGSPTFDSINEWLWWACFWWVVLVWIGIVSIRDEMD